MAVDGDICPRHHGVAQHGGGGIIGMALKGGRKLHHLLLGQGASRQRIAGGHACHCGGSGRAKEPRKSFRTHLVARFLQRFIAVLLL